MNRAITASFEVVSAELMKSENEVADDDENEMNTFCEHEEMTAMNYQNHRFAPQVLEPTTAKYLMDFIYFTRDDEQFRFYKKVSMFEIFRQDITGKSLSTPTETTFRNLRERSGQKFTKLPHKLSLINHRLCFKSSFFLIIRCRFKCRHENIDDVMFLSCNRDVLRSYQAIKQLSVMKERSIIIDGFMIRRKKTRPTTSPRE